MFLINALFKIKIKEKNYILTSMPNKTKNLTFTSQAWLNSGSVK